VTEGSRVIRMDAVKINIKIKTTVRPSDRKISKFSNFFGLNLAWFPPDDPYGETGCRRFHSKLLKVC